MTASSGKEQTPRPVGKGPVQHPELAVATVPYGDRKAYRKPELKRHGVLKSVAGSSGSGSDLSW
jgi:hypothetical protein